MSALSIRSRARDNVTLRQACASTAGTGKCDVFPLKTNAMPDPYVRKSPDYGDRRGRWIPGASAPDATPCGGGTSSATSLGLDRNFGTLRWSLRRCVPPRCAKPAKAYPNRQAVLNVFGAAVKVRRLEHTLTRF